MSVDLRMLPIGAAAWGGAAAGVIGLNWLFIACLSVGLSALFYFTKRRILLAVMLVLVASFALSSWRASVKVSDPIAVAAETNSVVQVKARIKTDPVVLESGNRAAACRAEAKVTSARIRNNNVSLSTSVYLYGSGQLADDLKKVSVGSEVSITAKARPTERHQRQSASLSVLKLEQISKPGALDELTNRIRSGLRASMAWSPAAQAGLVPSLVVGDTSNLSDEIEKSFKDTGLTHLTAVSGTNLTLLLAFVLPVAKLAGVRGRWLYLVSFSCVGMFILICRTEPSVLRAAAMGLIAMAATGLAADKRRGLRQLGGAVTALTLIDPWLALSWGFALSVTASFSILWWASDWQLKLRRWLPGPAAEAVAIPLAAQLGTQPLVTCLSSQLSVVGLFANALSGPFVGPVTVLGFVAAFVSMISPQLASTIGLIAGLSVQPIITLADFFASLPGASLQIPATVWSISALSIFCVILAYLLGMTLEIPAFTIGLCLVLVFCSIVPIQTVGWLPKDWLVIFCDVGQGSANLVRTGPASAVLLDAGLQDGKALECVKESRIKTLDAVVLSHRHADHVGGLKTVLNEYPTRNIFSPSELRDMSVQIIESGQEMTIGEAKFLFLGGRRMTQDVSEVTGQVENDAGITTLVEVEGSKAIFPGDVEIQGQQKLMNLRADLDSDIMSIPHHGSSHQLPEFFSAVSPRVAVASAGKDNDYGHPAAKTLSLASKSGGLVYRTDQNGSVAVAKKNGKLIVATQY